MFDPKTTLQKTAKKSSVALAQETAPSVSATPTASTPPAKKPRAKKAAHHCHAIGCERACPPECLMCAAHWRMVSRVNQRAVWAAYRPGQCDDKRPSGGWMSAADAAIAEVAVKEGKQAELDAWNAKQARIVEAFKRLAEGLQSAMSPEESSVADTPGASAGGSAKS